MKLKHFFIFLVIVLFAVSCAPQQEKPETAGMEKTAPSEIKQTKDDFGCFYSCDFFPEGSKQMCEDRKAGKQVQWPPDCKMMQYGPCIQLCEAEKKRTVSVGEQKQAFNVLPSLVQPEFADDVTAEDKNFVIQGISATDFYLKRWFGKSINQPAGLRVDAIESTGAQVVVENGKMVILIGTKSGAWKSMIESNKYGGEWRNRISAHEYVHVYQFHSGCGRLDVENLIAPRWFSEGEAEWLSYKAMQEAGLTPSFGITEMLVSIAKQETGSLSSFEGKDFGNKGGAVSVSQYSFFAMAIDYLMKDRPIKALDGFCANLADGKGMSMPKAFEAAFGITLEKFYEDFESYRKDWSSESSLASSPSTQG